MLHNITVSCSPESKIIELQKTDVGVFHIKRKMTEQETKFFGLDEEVGYGLRIGLWYRKTENLEIKF